jgi:hypothetical protein
MWFDYVATCLQGPCQIIYEPKWVWLNLYHEFWWAHMFKCVIKKESSVPLETNETRRWFFTWPPKHEAKVTLCHTRRTFMIKIIIVWILRDGKHVKCSNDNLLLCFISMNGWQNVYNFNNFASNLINW